jgi:hypothetical protein
VSDLGSPLTPQPAEDRGELASIIDSVAPLVPPFLWRDAERIADAVLAAGWRPSAEEPTATNWQPSVGDKVSYAGDDEECSGEIVKLGKPKHREALVQDDEGGQPQWFHFEDLEPAASPLRQGEGEGEPAPERVEFNYSGDQWLPAPIHEGKLLQRVGDLERELAATAAYLRQARELIRDRVWSRPDEPTTPPTQPVERLTLGNTLIVQRNEDQ